VESLQFFDGGAAIVKSTELYRDFVLQSEDFRISINCSYSSFVPLLSCESKKEDEEQVGLLKEDYYV